MKNFIAATLEHRRTTMSIMVVLLLAGIVSYITIPKEGDPDIPIPFFHVSVVHQGISPEDAERLLLKPLEKELRSVEGLEELQSVAGEGYAALMLKFGVDFDKQTALANVRDKVDLARAELPQESEEPLVQEFNTALFPVFVLALSGDVSERVLYQKALMLKDEIESISNVMKVSLRGAREELLEIIISPSAMASYNISPRELVTLVTQNNRLIAAGAVETNDGRFAVKVPGLFETQKDIMNLTVKTSGDGVVTVKDIAQIRRTFKDSKSYARHNGKPAMILEVSNRIGSNMLDTNATIRQRIESFTAPWPKAIKVRTVLDVSYWVRGMIESLQSAVLTAIALVMVVVVAVMGFRSAVMVGIAIPTSFMIGFVILDLMGFTVNMMVMFGMILSVGILVDGAIIIVEYADRKMAENMSSARAYQLAAKRMFWPIISSTATTLAAFLPMLFWPDVTGKFMRYLPITLIIVLSASLTVALVFLPVLGALIGKTAHKGNAILKSIAATKTKLNLQKLKGFTGFYMRTIARLIHRPIRVLTVGMAMVALIFFLYGKYGKGVEYSVDLDAEYGYVLVSARGNLSIQDIERLSSEVEKLILETPGIQTTFTQTGNSNNGNGGSGGDTPPDLISTIMMQFLPYDQRQKSNVILENIRQRASKLAGIHVEVRKEQRGPGGGKDIKLELVSHDYAALLSTVDTISTYIKNNVQDLTDIEDTRPLPGIEWIIKVDREMAGRFGADVTTLGAIVQLVTNGILLGKYRPDDSNEEVDIRVRFASSQRHMDQLDSMRLQTSKGQVPISNFVTRQARPMINKIERLDGKRQIQLRANTAVNPQTGEKTLAGKKINEITQWLEQQTFPPSISWKFRGSNEEQQKSFVFLLRAMIAALFLMFIILLTQFNSFYYAFLTLSTVVLSTTGVFLGMVITQQNFSVIMTGVGVVALAGIVVNNSIVLIDTYQRLLTTKITPIEAVLRAAAQRLRPILLTTITTICGLLPMALQISVNFFDRSLSIGEPTSGWWVQLATAVIFGLGFSTLLTLILIPVMIALPSVWKEKVKQSKWPALALWKNWRHKVKAR